MEKSFQQRIEEYAKIRGIRIDNITALSQRAALVNEYTDERNIYFSKNDYAINHPQIWRMPNGSCSLFPLETNGTGLGILPETCGSIGFEDPKNALTATQLILTPRTEQAKWHSPQTIETLVQSSK